MAGSTRDDRRGARDGNDRIARIARWLHLPVASSSVDRLVLMLEDGDTLGSWPRADVLGAEDAIAYKVDAVLVDSANDQGTTVTARLAWFAGDSAWASKTFRAPCDAAHAETIRPLDGTLMSMLQANQRHTEALAQQIATFNLRSDERVERFFGVMERVMTLTLTRLEDAEQRRAEAEAREVQALELAEQATSAAETAKADAEAAANDDTIGKIVEIGTKQLLAGGSK